MDEDIENVNELEIIFPMKYVPLIGERIEKDRRRACFVDSKNYGNQICEGLWSLGHLLECNLAMKSSKGNKIGSQIACFWYCRSNRNCRRGKMTFPLPINRSDEAVQCKLQINGHLNHSESSKLMRRPLKGDKKLQILTAASTKASSVLATQLISNIPEESLTNGNGQFGYNAKQITKCKSEQHLINRHSVDPLLDLIIHVESN